MSSSSDATGAKCPFAGTAAPNPHLTAAPVAPASTTTATPNALPSPKEDNEGERNRLSEITRTAKLHRFNSPLYYHDYLNLDTLLAGVKPRSRELGCEAHDEHLFIVIHQVYELWFKQILYELDSVRSSLSQDYIPEKAIGTAVARLRRVTEIQRILVEQLTVLETMSPLGFLDFRDLLFPASGFQSVQWRKIENTLGLTKAKRMPYSGRSYCTYLSEVHSKEVQATEDRDDNVLRLVERWLERTPFLNCETTGFDFWESYRVAIDEMLANDRLSISENPLSSTEQKEAQLEEVAKSVLHYNSLFDEEAYEKLRERGDRQLSYKAMKAALLIHLYQDEPILQLPFSLLNSLVEVDERLTQWRHRHSLMVHRMLGVKIGTGGSSGYMYLRTAANRHRIFSDFFNLPTFLIPRHNLPVLPDHVKKQMRFAIESSATPTSTQ